MLHDIIAVQPLGGHRLFLKFEDGTTGEADLSTTLRFTGVFLPLADPAAFARVSVNPESGTIVWPNGADLCPDVLYSLATGAASPSARGERAV